jgi:hypothetical protein
MSSSDSRDAVIEWGEGFYIKKKFSLLVVLLTLILLGFFIFLNTFSDCLHKSDLGLCIKYVANDWHIWTLVCLGVALYGMIAGFVVYWFAKKTKVDVELIYLIVTFIPAYILLLFADLDKKLLTIVMVALAIFVYAARKLLNWIEEKRKN